MASLARRHLLGSQLGARRILTPALRPYTTAVKADLMTGEPIGLRDLDASALAVTKTAAPKEIPPSAQLVFGSQFSDHMLSIPWNSTTGWAAPHIHPYGPLKLDPSAVVFHYAPTLFEGLKAYKDTEGRVRLFRPDMNMKRMNRTAARIALPTFDGEQLVKMIKKLVTLDSRWIPSEPGHSLYIRPTLIGTQSALGVGPSSDALLFVLTCPVGPYYRTGFKPVSLLASTEYVRAWPGGTGSYKLGANYAPGVLPQLEAAKSGYQQILWLLGEDHKVTEVGTMNLFVVIENEGSLELITPPLGDTILPGVTRDSILSLARSHSTGASRLASLPASLKVSERNVTMPELVAAAEQGKLVEAFGAGTAAIVSPIERIGYMGKDIKVPIGEDGLGMIAKAMLDQITGIQLGKIPHEWSVLADEA